MSTRTSRGAEGREPPASDDAPAAAAAAAPDVTPDLAEALEPRSRAGARTNGPTTDGTAAAGVRAGEGARARRPHGDDQAGDDQADVRTDQQDGTGQDRADDVRPVVAVASSSRAFSPFAVGFTGALGVLLAVGLVQAVVQAGQIVTLVFAALFLALSLDPFVSFLERRGLPRPAAVGATFTLLVVLVGGFVAAVAPLVVSEGSQLIRVSPIYANRIEQSTWAQSLDDRFGLFERINAEVEARLSSSSTIDALFGGVLGAGRAVVTGVFSVLLVLILTLYFLASLRSITSGAYRLVPASSRDRVREIGEEAQRRVGGYVLGQLGVATLNGLLSFVVMTILDVRYSIALAFTVGVFGLIPLIGATLGAILACTVAFLGDPTSGIVLAVWFLVYQQVENYLILPRIMGRTVAVPSTLAVVAALVGGSLLGLIGALVAIPLAATILLVVQRVVYPRMAQR